MKQDSIELLVDYNRSLWHNNRDKWERLWQKRCGDCLAPCCFLDVGGLAHNYNEDNIITEGRKYFSHDFIILHMVEKYWQTHTEHGFNLQLNPPELQYSDKGLRVCPLAVNGRCIIYEDRPYICRKFTCVMKVGNFYKT